MILADLFTAIDRVSAGEVGPFSTPSRSEYVVDQRNTALWDLKPVFGLMLETLGRDVSGGIHPMTSNASKDQALTKVYLRDPAVVQSAHAQAAGLCEHCHRPAPFLTKSGQPFLEVHHMLPLATGGPDQGANVIALCPNCHRMAHHGAQGLT